VDLELGPESPRDISGIAPALRVVPSPQGDVAWLVQPGIGHLSTPYPTIVDLVELPSGRRLATFEIDANAFPIGATASGLVLNTETLIDTGDGWISEPGSAQILHLMRDRTTVNLFQGRALAVSSSRIVFLRGESLVIGSADGGGSHEVPRPDPGTWLDVGGPGLPSDAMPLQVMSPDGSRLLVAIGDALDVKGTPETSTLYSIDLDTNATTAIARFQGAPPLATWSRDGQWIILVDIRDLTVISRTDPSNTYSLPGIVPEGHWVLAAG
jgi:hypothetical protein